MAKRYRETHIIYRRRRYDIFSLLFDLMMLLLTNGLWIIRILWRECR